MMLSLLVLPAALTPIGAGAAGLPEPLMLDPQPLTPPPSGMGLVTALAYLTLFVAVGLPWFRFFIVRNVDGASMRMAYLTGAVAILCQIVLAALTRLWEQGESVDRFFTTDAWTIEPGHGTVRALVFVVIGVAVEYVFVDRDVKSRVNQLAVFGGGILALGSLTVVGHTATLDPAWVAHGADFAHGLAGAFWVGGIIGLARYLVDAHAGATADERNYAVLTAADVLERFSAWAFWSVVVLMASGVTMAYFLLPSLSTLWSNVYGRLIALKVAILLIPLAMAAWNKLQLVPRLADQPDDFQAWAMLRRTVLIEAAAILTILLVTGFMVLRNPGA